MAFGRATQKLGKAGDNGGERVYSLLVERAQVFGRSKKAAELCDSPLERGGGVCPLRFINTPLQPHFPTRPLSRGELFTGKNKSSEHLWWREQ